MSPKRARAPLTWWLVLLPWVNFLRHGRLLQAFVCLLIQETIYLWPVAVIWARTAHRAPSLRWSDIDFDFGDDEPTSYRPHRR